MDNLIQLLSTLAPGVYGVGGIITALGLLLYWQARHRLRQAQYPLEKENAETRGGCGITLFLMAGQIVLLMWLLLNVFYSTYQDVTTITIEATPFGGDLVFREAGEAPANSGPQIPPPTGCPADSANITSPANGSLITEAVPIIGTATVLDFSHYRFEVMRAGETQFGVLGGASSDYDQSVENSELGTLDPLDFAVGEHRFRLVVFDRDNVNRAACEITLFMSELPAQYAALTPTAQISATATP